VKTYTVVFAPEAEAQLADLYHYIAKEASPKIAFEYTSAIIEHCEKLHSLPHRGTPRDDIRPGLRVTHYKRRTVIAYAVEREQVLILGVFYGGQDFESALATDPED
jgi:toxin ParE1/3/4